MGKAQKITISEEDKEYLHSIVRSNSSLTLVSQKAWALLLREKGVPINVIIDIVGLTREKISYCIAKLQKEGVKNAIHDAPKRGRSKGSDFSNEEKAWVVNIVSQRPINVGFPAEIWTYTRLTKYINEKAKEEGFARLATISRTSIVNILRQAGLQPKRIRYPEHLQRRYPDASNIYFPQ